MLPDVSTTITIRHSSLIRAWASVNDGKISASLRSNGGEMLSGNHK